MKNTQLAAAIIAVAFSVSAQAEETELENQVTVADRIESPVINPAQILVLDRRDIELSGAQSVVSLLNSQEGIQFSANGGVASTTTMYINGLNSTQILFLLNGQRIGSATTGTTALQLIPLEQIERIEVFKGARAAVYGADAQGGVVNIITRQDDVSHSVSATLGTQQTRQVSVRTGLAGNNWQTYLNATHNQSAGYNVQSAAAADNDADGFRRNGFSAGGKIRLSENQSAGIDLQNNRGELEYDNTWNTDDQQDFDNRSYSAWYELTAEALSVKLQTGRTLDQNWNYESGAGRGSGSLFASRQDNTMLSAAYRFNTLHTLLAGADYKSQDVARSDTAYDETQVSNKGAFLGYRFTGESVALEAGSRYDKNDQFGEFWSFNTNAVLTFDNGDSLAFGQATAFRAPTFNELYYPGYGNPDLEVERSRIWNLDYTLPWATGLVKISGQRALFHNQIGSSAATGYLPDNVGHSVINSVNATVEQTLTETLNIRLTQEWLDARDLDNDTRLLRRSPHSTKGVLNWQWQQWYVQAEGIYREGAKDSGNVQLASYSLFNLNVNYRLTNNSSLGLRIDNLTDHEYETVSGYPAQGRYAQLTGRYNF